PATAAGGVPFPTGASRSPSPVPCPRPRRLAGHDRPTGQPVGVTTPARPRLFSRLLKFSLTYLLTSLQWLLTAEPEPAKERTHARSKEVTCGADRGAIGPAETPRDHAGADAAHQPQAERARPALVQAPGRAARGPQRLDPNRRLLRRGRAEQLPRHRPRQPGGVGA